MTTKYVTFDKLKRSDQERVKRKNIYPYRTKGHGVRKYHYPVNKSGDLIVGRSRKHI